VKPALALAFLTIAAGLGCARKPATGAAVQVFSTCGPMPPAAALSCADVLNPDGTLKPGKAATDFAECTVDDLDAILTENEQLRTQFAPCATPVKP
jgi:hypothetical protein